MSATVFWCCAALNVSSMAFLIYALILQHKTQRILAVCFDTVDGANNALFIGSGRGWHPPKDAPTAPVNTHGTNT